MSETLRVILLIALIAAFLTTGALLLSWWMESERRLRRALRKALGTTPELQALAPAEGRAAGLDFESEQLVVLWKRGAQGLLYAFEEVLGAEIIVDGHVVARVLRAQVRKDLDVLAPDAEHVVLRLMFNDTRHPEFELGLWDANWVAPAPGQVRNAPPIGSPSEGLRLGRRWLSHIEALTKR